MPFAVCAKSVSSFPARVDGVVVVLAIGRIPPWNCSGLAAPDGSACDRAATLVRGQGRLQAHVSHDCKRAVTCLGPYRGGRKAGPSRFDATGRTTGPSPEVP